MPYHTIQYHTILCHTIPYHTTLCHTIAYYTILCHTILCHTIPYYAIPYYAIPYHTMPYHTMPYHTMPYHNILYHTTLCHTIPYQNKPNQTVRLYSSYVWESMMTWYLLRFLNCISCFILHLHIFFIIWIYSFMFHICLQYLRSNSTATSFSISCQMNKLTSSII